MNTLAVIPSADPLPLPSPHWLLWFLLMLTWVLHVVAMNFVLGGSLIAASARIRPDVRGHRLAKSLAKAMPSVVAVAITFGVAPLLFVQALYGRLFFSSSVLMAWWWFAVVPILILAYYGTYLLSFAGEKLGNTAKWISSLVTLLFLAISLIYSTNMSMMLRPQNFLAKYLQDGRGLHMNFSDPTLLPRWLHMVLGAMAVAGLIVALYGVAQKDAEYGAWVVRHGSTWFVIATAISVFAGIWWIAALPREVLLLFMGQSVAGTIMFALGIVLGLGVWAMMLLAMRSPAPAKLVKGSASALVLALIAMALMRDEVRRGMMQLADFAPTDRVVPQWGVIALFAILLVAALGTTAWMVVILLRPSATEISSAPPASKPQEPALMTS